MKKIRLVASILCICLMFGTDGQNISAEEHGSVAINEQNFPDIKIRKMVKEDMFNKDHDDVLTWEEIQNATVLVIATEDTMEPGDWDITGIEKLENLKSVVLTLQQSVQKGKVITGREIKGTFRNNAKLTQIVLDAGGRTITQDKIEDLFPMDQIKELRIENADIQKISLSKAANLENLTIKNCDHLEKLDVKGAKRLKKIVVENTSVKKLDLTKNAKLKEVSVQFGSSCLLTDLKTGKNGKIPFFKWSEKACKIQFPKGNTITKLNYFTTDKEIDLSKCKKLKEIHISKNTRLKVQSQWYKTNGKRLVVYAEGFRQTKLNAKKSQNSTLLKATKFKDVSKGYYCKELDEENDS